MSRIYLLLFSVVLITACTKQVDQNQPEPTSIREQPFCGAEIASQSIPAKYLEELAAQRVASLREKLTIYLDFDGEVIRPGTSTSPNITASVLLFSSPKFCPPPSLSTAYQAEIIRLIEDDFAPFNIEFTTDRTIYDAAPSNSRMICVFTTLPSTLGFSANTHGIAPAVINPITSQPAFVFCTAINNFFPANQVSIMASVASHEIGHMFSLRHQSVFGQNCFIISEYHSGFGVTGGLLSFAPIMGTADERLTTWFDQPTCQNQNDFNVINNFIELKTDDHPDSPVEMNAVEGNFSGVLGQAGDVDYIFIRPQAPVSLQVTADNIDLKVSYLTPGGHVLASYNDPSDLSLIIPNVVGVGYLKVEAESNANLQSQFMTGKYSVTYLEK